MFSRASNSDLDKEKYYDRRDIVKRVSNNLKTVNTNDDSLIKLLTKQESKNNSTISYKNIYDDENTMLGIDPLLSKVYEILKIKSKCDLKILSSIYYNLETDRTEIDVLNSMDKIMSSGFNRIVIVERDAFVN